MHGLLSATLPLALLIVSAAAPDEKQDTAPFQGRWKFTAIVVSGESVAPVHFSTGEVTVTGDERILRDGGEVRGRAKYKVDATKSPKQIDISVSEGPFKGRTLKGVYEFKGDELTINVTIEGEDRPTDFKCETGSNRLLQKFRRVLEKGK